MSCYNVVFCLSQHLGRGQLFVLYINVHEQAQSNPSCNSFNFAVLDFVKDFFFIFNVNNQFIGTIELSQKGNMTIMDCAIRCVLVILTVG
jgi:hypothetical protein